MIVQLSSGQGPAECELAVVKLYESLKSEYGDIELIHRHEADTHSNRNYSNFYRREVTVPQ